ncbi:MAG: glycosyltransferase family 39 protein, partial [Acidobacteriota bacterium]
MLSRLVKLIGPGIALYFLLFHGLADVAFLSADEPRYASIGRAMAQTGDWITPRLNGEAWFEKPPLLYWMTATAWRFGLRDEVAARLPVAMLSAAFLIFFYFWLRREFGDSAAFTSASILATSVGWIVFSNVAVTDLPLAACFSVAMLLALPSRDGTTRPLPLWAGVFLGLAMLAKGLVPAVLALPALYFWRSQWKRVLVIALLAGVVALPWFVVASVRNGALPWQELILKHHFARFFGGEIHHERPFWFYVPVLLGGLLPWTPALVGLRRRANEGSPWSDVRLQYLAAWAGFGFLFFSASTNKLPGYLLPILPPIAALMGIRFQPSRGLKLAIAACVPMLVFGASILPDALTDGLTHAPLQLGNYALIAASAVAAFFSPPVAVAAIALWAKLTVYPVLDQHLGARQLWKEIQPRAAETCVEWIGRDWQYGLDYYAQPRLPACDAEARALELVGENGV